MLRPITIALVLLAVTVPVSAAEEGCQTSLEGSSAALSRTDHTITGNRLVAGCGPLDGVVVDVALRGRPAWVLPDPSDRGGSWFVVLDDGSVEHVITAASGVASVSDDEWPPLEPGQPPLALALAQGQVVVGSTLGALDWFPDALPDTRLTEVVGSALVALAGPTDRYDHGVLGDEFEASAIEVRDESGALARIEVGAQEVVEGIAAMVVELRPDDAGQELLVTVSDAEVGARLRAYDLAGDVVVESDAIGRGYRWLHQVGADRIAPDGELEIIAVRTPHIGGIVEAYRLVGDRLERAATAEGYSSHQLGSANLDMALLADVDGDGRREVVVPRQGMTELAALRRNEDGFEEIERLPLDGGLVTNVAATPDASGALVLAAGTDDGRLRIFR
jgi:hypothetical protein